MKKCEVVLNLNQTDRDHKLCGRPTLDDDPICETHWKEMMFKGTLGGVPVYEYTDKVVAVGKQITEDALSLRKSYFQKREV